MYTQKSYCSSFPIDLKSGSHRNRPLGKNFIAQGREVSYLFQRLHYEPLRLKPHLITTDLYQLLLKNSNKQINQKIHKAYTLSKYDSEKKKKKASRSGGWVTDSKQ